MKQLHWARIPAGIGAIAFLVLQVLPGPSRDNPPVNHTETLEASLEVPAPVSVILNRACRNCHSNETAWPWYSKVAPGSWLVAGDVRKARKAMNFSTWAKGPGRSPGIAAAMLAAACADVRSGRMPLPQYQVMHPESRLNAADQAVFCEWADGLSTRLLSERIPPGKLEAKGTKIGLTYHR